MESGNQSSPTSLPTGSRIKLIGLQRSTHLNNRQGIIIGAPTQGSTRYQVYVFRLSSEDCNTDPIFVRVQPKNIQPLPATPPTEPPSPASPASPASPKVPHPLTTLKRVQIRDTIPRAIAPTTHFFGSVPPTYLLRGVPLTKKHASILLLACGDIRSVLYTVSRRSAAHGSFPNITVTLNDNEPCVIARNIILLWLILRTRLDHTLLFEIWFSLRISACAYAAVVEAVAALTGPHRHRELRAIHVAFHSDSDRDAVYHFLNEWILWRDKFDMDMIFATRRDVMNDLYNRDSHSRKDPMSESIAFAHHIVGDADFPKEAARSEIEDYISTGCVLIKHPQDHLNPTMFKSPTEYSVHFQSVPYNAFPSFAPSYNERTPLRTASMTQLKQWVDAMRKCGRKNEYVVSTTDCLAFAMELTEQFDIVAMSNITDIVGLLPTLQATRGLVASSGYMYTKTFRSTRHKGYVEGYLSTHLNLPPELLPAVLGWRCIGWEGKNNPDNCVVTKVPGSDGRSCEVLLTWQPAAASNVPLDAAKCDHVQNLYTSVRDRVWMSLRSHPDDIHDKALALRVVNPLALLPVFVSACNVANIFGPRARSIDVEFSDVLGFITTGAPSDIMMASVPISRSSLRLWALEPSDPRDIFTIRLDSGIPYAAIKVRFTEENNSYIVSWMMSRERANGVERVHLMSCRTHVVSLSTDEVSFSNVSRNQWDSWLCRASSFSEDTVEVRRVERRDSCDIIFHMPQDYIDAERSNKLLVRRCQHSNHSIEVVNRNHGKEQKQVFHLPYPTDGVRGGLKVEGGKEAKFEVQKAKYSTESLFLADSQNKVCLFATTNVPLQYVQWLVPQQFSPNELLRSELGKLQWNILGTCKGITSSILHDATAGSEVPLFLQSDDEETGQTQSLMVLVGPVRRDECTGNIAVDVKWMHKPTTMTPRAMRDQMDWPPHPPMTHCEFQAVLRMLELHSEHKPKSEEIRNFGDFMVKSQDMWREFPGTFRASRLRRTGEEGPAVQDTITDRMHLLCGGRIGYATLTAMMWPGQVEFIEREGLSLVTSEGMGFDELVEGWLKRGRDHERRDNAGYALLAFEQGAGQGLMMMRTRGRTGKLDAVVECLLESAATRLALRNRKDYPLISACCNKAIELIGNSEGYLKRKAERLLSKVVDLSQLTVSSP